MGERLFLLGVFVLFSTGIVNAVQIQEWGEVTEEEWAIDSFAEDEDAHSIILFDLGESYIDRNLNVVHNRHKRIKILNPNQSDFTDIRVPVFDDRSIQRLRNIEAQTINRRPDGSEVIIEIGRRDFYTENSGNWEITTFTFPTIEAGSIVEYKYTIIYGNPISLPDWTFQHSSPILHSEYNVMVPDMISYRSYNYGYESFEEISSNENDEVLKRMNRYVDAMQGNSRNTIYRTVLKNAPAVRSESHISTLDNYKNRVKYQLIGTRDRFGTFTSYMSTWEEITERLIDSRGFGGAFSSRRSLRRTTEDIITDIDDDLEKAKAIYHFVASKVQWDNRFRIIPSDRAHNILDDLAGNSADKAVLLTSMFRAADLNADPVLISTRGHGWVDWNYPNINAFNHVLVLLTVADTHYLLDPVNELIPFGLLHPTSLNDTGLLITEEDAHIVDILPRIESSSQSTAHVTLSADGSIFSFIRSTYYGYESIIHRTLADRDGEEEYLESNMLQLLPDSEILTMKIKHLDNPDEPFSVELELENEHYTAVANDLMYLNPFLVDRVTENPFSNPVRNYPVEFNFGTSKRYAATVIIPEGYEVLEIPESRAVRFTDNMVFNFACEHVGNTVQLSIIQVNNDRSIDPEYYEDLRKYYSSLAEVYNQQIVFRKTDTVSSIPGEKIIDGPNR